MFRTTLVRPSLSSCYPTLNCHQTQQTMLAIFLFSVFYTVNPAFSSVCKHEFEETVCENFEFSPEITLDSAANKLIIKNAKGTVAEEALARLNSATELTITESELAEIEPKALCAANLTSLTLLNNRKIPKITKNTLNNCRSLKTLYLDGPAVVVENGAFADAPNLRTLTFNETALPDVLERATFRGLDSLKSLTIRHSKFSRIREDAFDDLKDLKFLDLQNNGIEEIAPTTFRKLPALKVLNLADNKLKSLRWDEFQDLKALRVLFLERNDFKNVDVDKLVASVPDLERIFLSYDKLAPENRKQIEETLPKMNITVIYSGKEINSK